MDGMTTNWALMGIAACGLLVVGLLAALLLFAGYRCAQPTRPDPSYGLKMGGGDLILAGDGQAFL